MGMILVSVSLVLPLSQRFTTRLWILKHFLHGEAEVRTANQTTSVKTCSSTLFKAYFCLCLRVLQTEIWTLFTSIKYCITKKIISIICILSYLGGVKWMALKSPGRSPGCCPGCWSRGLSIVQELSEVLALAGACNQEYQWWEFTANRNRLWTRLSLVYAGFPWRRTVYLLVSDCSVLKSITANASQGGPSGLSLRV